MKLLLTLTSGILAVWMGTSFVSPADPTPMDGPVVAPEHGDSHRLGAMDSGTIELPQRETDELDELRPLFGDLVLVD